MTVDLEKVRERHETVVSGKGAPFCGQCTGGIVEPPCDAIQLATELEQAREEIERLREDKEHGHRQLTQQTTQLREQSDDLMRVGVANESLRAELKLSSSAICEQIEVNTGLRGEVERLRAWVNDLQAGMYINCVYCGHRYGPDTDVSTSMAEVLKEHIERCPEHPMAALKKENDRRGSILAECARLIPIARPLPDRIRFLLAENGHVRKALGRAASVAADEAREDCGESIAKRVFHAVKAVARAALSAEARAALDAQGGESGGSK